MKPLTFILSAMTAGLLLGFVIVATGPTRTTAASARPLGKPLPNVAGRSLGDVEALLERRGVEYQTSDRVGLIESLFVDQRTVCQTSPAGPAFLRPGESVELIVDSYC